MGALAGKGGVRMGSCQGLWVGLGDCPPQVGGVPSVPVVFSSVLSLVGPGVDPARGWGWGTWHGLGCLFIVGRVSLSVCREQGAGDPWRH